MPVGCLLEPAAERLAVKRHEKARKGRSIGEQRQIDDAFLVEARNDLEAELVAIEAKALFQVIAQNRNVMQLDLHDPPQSHPH